MFNSSLAPDVVKTAIDMVFDGTFSVESIPGYATVTSKAFMQSSTDRAAVIVDQFMGAGYFEERAEMQDVPQGTARVGNQKTFSVTNFSKSIDISKNLMDDDQHDTIAKLIKSFGRNARLTKEKNAYKQFNLGFTTVLTNDGIALFSASHVTLDGTTVSNLLTGALSPSNLDSAVQSLINQVTQDGVLGGHMPTVLLVPPALFKLALEITKSERASGTANNDLNYYSSVYPGMQVLMNPFLGANFGGSDTAYFLLSADHSMYRWVRQDLETSLIDWRTQRNNNYIYKAEYREVVGPISFEGIVASNGTTA